MAARIMIVEDEPAIQQMIAINIKQAGYEAICAGSAEVAIDVINNILPDLILVDWMLPNMSGLEFARRLRKHSRTQRVPIIMLTARSDESDKISGLDVGADDYVTKPFSPRELIARIKAVLRRRAPEALDESVEVDGLLFDPVNHRISVGNTEIVLGPTEHRLLYFLMTHIDRVFSRAQLLDRVWGDHVFVEERTVDVHIRRLRKALENVGKENLIRTVRGAGYRFSANSAVDSGELKL
ncbi:MAG: phosphate regulon transcriptional regulator PhoB [Nitrosomonas sp.]|nr:phosphate regulon transcriptional regulator PhoB [Nitrosomonas sp.]